MGWVSAEDDRDATIGVAAELAAPFAALYESLWTQPHIPADVLELCRLRLAQLHQCAVELQRHDAVIPAEKAECLAGWAVNPIFSPAEGACLAFTEVYAIDTQALTDQHADAVKHHFGDSGLVLLVEALGILDGMTRLSLLWQLGANANQAQASDSSQ